jgi:tetratricopeptide (TPR) repeat protein
VHWLVGVTLLAGAAGLVHQGGWATRAQELAADRLATHTGGAVAKPPKTIAKPPKTAAKQSKTTAPTGVSGAVLNDAGFALIRAGDYRGAMPLLEQAVQRLAGSGSIVDAYALYNLARARFEVGRCDGVLSMLDRSQARQGHRAAIDHLRQLARRRC